MLGKMWTFWGGASAASYLLAPPQWQPSAAAAAAVLWSAYVSYRLHHPAPEEAEMANASAIDDYLREHRSDRYDVRAGGGDDKTPATHKLVCAVVHAALPTYRTLQSYTPASPAPQPSLDEARGARNSGTTLTP